jgi:hypothetical protein
VPTPQGALCHPLRAGAARTGVTRGCHGIAVGVSWLDTLRAWPCTTPAVGSQMSRGITSAVATTLMNA